MFRSLFPSRADVLSEYYGAVFAKGIADSRPYMVDRKSTIHWFMLNHNAARRDTYVYASKRYGEPDHEALELTCLMVAAKVMRWDFDKTLLVVDTVRERARQQRELQESERTASELLQAAVDEEDDKRSERLMAEYHALKEANEKRREEIGPPY